MDTQETQARIKYQEIRELWEKLSQGYSAKGKAVAFKFATLLKSVTLRCSQKFRKTHGKTPSDDSFCNLRIKIVLLRGNLTEKSFLAIEIQIFFLFMRSEK